VKNRVNKEIGNYPSPIPAFDVPFNYLLEERSKISVALKRVDNSLTKYQTETIETETIEEFIEMSSQIDDGIAARLKAAFNRTKHKLVQL
jgi:Iap family predicted aminopeptidase